MREEFEKLVAAGKISNKHLEPLLKLAQCGYCMHRSWGFGKITTVDTVFGRFTIDFQNKPGHSMDLSFAAESLRPIPSDHILARKASDLNSLRQMAALNHLDLIKIVLESYGGKATVEQIQQVLVPDVISDDWKKWWEIAKRELKKNGHFKVPYKKSDPIVYHTEEISLQDRILGEFRSAKGLKAKVGFAQELHKNLLDLTDQKAAAQEAITALNSQIASHQRTMPSLALEAIFIRDDLAAACELPPEEGQLKEKDVWDQAPFLAQVLETIPANKHRRTLHSFKEAFPDTYVDTILTSINLVPAKQCGEFAQLLIQNDHLEALKETLARLISQHAASSELLLWLAKERSSSFADILGPEVFRAMLTSMERDQFNEKKSNRLRDHIVSDQELLIELIESADIEVIRDLTRALQLSTSFDDMDKRSLLARIVKHFPSVQSLITGEQGKHDAGLIVSWESLERRRNEYHNLVHKKIPANSKEIAVARSYGDLKENHEFKAAKEMQKMLMKNKAELENQLSRARGTDFSNPRTDIVSVGTVVRVVEINSDHHETFTILGAWDFDAEQNFISYLSPIAQSLLNRKVGEEVELETEEAKKCYRIESIEAYKKQDESTAKQ